MENFQKTARSRVVTREYPVDGKITGQRSRILAKSSCPQNQAVIA